MEISSRFYDGANGESWTDPFGEFIHSLWTNGIEPGATFYVGGIVDYHF